MYTFYVKFEGDEGDCYAVRAGSYRAAARQFAGQAAEYATVLVWSEDDYQNGEAPQTYKLDSNTTDGLAE